VEEIAAACNEQANGIEQINKAVAEMDKVVQQNAANAEESAGASEEMNAQTAELNAVVIDLINIIGGSKSTGYSDHSGKTKLKKSVLHSRKPKDQDSFLPRLAGPMIPANQ
jgi:methyl-accepting chemotaxis protein